MLSFFSTTNSLGRVVNNESEEPPIETSLNSSYFGFENCSVMAHIGMYNSTVIDDSSNNYAIIHQSNVDNTQSITGDGRYSLNGNGQPESTGNAYIEIDTIDFPNPVNVDGFSVSFWMYPTDTNTNSKCIFSINEYLAMGQATNETITYVYMNFGTGATNLLYFMPALTLNVWTHFIINYNPDANTALHRFWKDGVEFFPSDNGKPCTMSNYPVGNTNNRVFIGRPNDRFVDNTGQGYWWDNVHCFIDDFYILDGCPSASDVIRLRETSPMTMFFTFEDTSGTILYDDCRVYNSTIYGSCVDTQRAKMNLHGATFDEDILSSSATKYIVFPQIDIFSSKMSISMWIWTNSGLLSNKSKVFDFYADSGAITDLFLFNYSDTDKTKYRFGASTSTDFNMPVNKWNHFVATIDGATVKIYANNVLQCTHTYGTNIAPSSKIDSGGLLARTLNTSNQLRAFTGTVDMLRFFNNVLSTDAINVLYNGGD